MGFGSPPSLAYNIISFWSDPTAKITVPAVAADLDFPYVTISGLTALGGTVKRAYAVLFARSIADTSSGANAINGSGKRIRVKVSTGAWGTDDIPAFDFVDNQLYCLADAKENGFLFTSKLDIKAVVSADGTFNFRAEQTNRLDAIVVDGASLELYDVVTGIVIEFER